MDQLGISPGLLVSQIVNFLLLVVLLRMLLYKPVLHMLDQRRERIAQSKLPGLFEGAPISFITAGILAMAFAGFAGLA